MRLDADHIQGTRHRRPSLHPTICIAGSFSTATETIICCYHLPPLIILWVGSIFCSPQSIVIFCWLSLSSMSRKMKDPKIISYPEGRGCQHSTSIWKESRHKSCWLRVPFEASKIRATTHLPTGLLLRFWPDQATIQLETKHSNRIVIPSFFEENAAKTQFKHVYMSGI